MSHLARVNPPELAAPSGFSHAVTARGAGLVFLAGQTALDATGQVVSGGIVAQFERALTNLLTALAGAGGEPADLAKVTIYAIDPEDYREHAAEIGAVWRSLAGRDFPAMALIGIVRLWDVEALVELEGIAVLPAAAD
jgi:enamine deaminase RidA (YjgF/YER057c/UK114 family)